MNDTMDVILVKKCNQSDEFRTVLPAKLCVRVRVIMILAAAAVLVVGAGVGAAEKTWYVDDGGGEGINFTKIQDAVNNASEGDTVIVYGGTYKEAIAVNERLILRGIDHPVVDAITIRTDVCVIDGFIVTGSENFGIYVNSNYNTIVNCSIYNNGDDGICLSYSDDNVITNNSVLNNSGNGIHSWHSSHNLLTNNTISLSDGDGIRLENSHYNSIINNSIFGNYGGGVDMMGLSHNTVTNNTIYSNTGDAIAVRGSLYNCIVNNTIYSNGDDGISLSRSWGIEPVVWGSSQNTIMFNVIYLNSDDGIELKNSTNNNITNNIVYANEDTGICAKNSSDNQIYNNNLIDNDEHASDDCSDNLWDMGQTAGGNYWSGHACTGNPSDGSQPYYIDVDSIDQYPFADPIGEIPQLPSPQPNSNIDVHKKEYLSTNDAHINHSQIYNFTIKWIANVWDVENLDNVTYTITTSENFVYQSNWELYQNGTENSFTSPPVIEGQNYTWLIPLKERIGSNINFILEPSQTVQGNPWVDMNVNTTGEGDYTRVNVTFMPVIPLDWIGLPVKGDRIIEVSAYPPEFEIDILTSSYVKFDSGDINQDQVYNFSVLVDNPNNIKLWLDASFGWVEEPPSNTITLPVAELGSVTAKADVPVIWEHKQTQPKRGQNIKIDMSGWITTPQTGDLNGDDRVTPADAAIVLHLAASGAHDPAADVSGDGQVTSLDALMILQAAAGSVTL